MNKNTYSLFYKLSTINRSWPYIKYNMYKLSKYRDELYKYDNQL